ncbi:8224_t:CDS:1, partial [Entrophospora sp. SA101]
LKLTIFLSAKKISNCLLASFVIQTLVIIGFSVPAHPGPLTSECNLALDIVLDEAYFIQIIAI